MGFLAIIIAISVILPFTLPFIIFCIGIFVRRKYSVKFSVAKCGFKSFSSISVVFPTQDDYISVQIETLKLSYRSPLTVCVQDITIQSPLGDGSQLLPIKIESLEVPIKFRTDFLKHFVENLKISIKNVVIVVENFSYRVEGLDINRSLECVDSFKIEFNRVIFSDLSIPEVQQSSDMPRELTNQRILFLEQLQLLYLIGHNKNLQLSINGDCFLQWNLEFHINIVSLVRCFKQKVTALRGPRRNTPKIQPQVHHKILNLKLDLNGRVSIGASVSEDCLICIETDSLEVNATFPGPKTVQSKSILIHFDDNTILSCSMASMSHYPSPGISCILDRKQNSCGYKLKDSANSLLCVEFDTVKLSFPYGYDFAEIFNEKFMGIVKWLKNFHMKDRKPKANRPIDFDISVRINKFLFDIEDDPFETKLRNNYMLLEDEYHEQIKRDQTLQDKINELKRTNLMLASTVVEELNRALAKKNSDIYVQRSRQLYSSEFKKIPLFRVAIEDIDFKVLADSSFHNHSDIKSMISLLNPESPMSGDITFTTLWCRIVSANLKTAEVILRDFPMPLFSLKDLTVKGTILGSEQTAVPRAKRSCRVYVGRVSQPVTVERSMTPLKFFHNLQLRSMSANYSHGPCWEPVLQQVFIAFENIVSSSNDPSPTMPFWDKFRFMYHGMLKLNCNQLSVILHASNDPYNQTEMIELSLSRAQIDMTTGKIKVKSDFDVLLRTASKYDECRFIHIPNLDITALLDWNCLGNPNDHHSIMPCAPDKVPDYSSHLTHDSYRSFRSQSLNLSLNIETQFTSPTSSLNPDNVPSMLFFGSTIRWLENQKSIFTGPSKLTRRGKLFHNTKPRKQPFGRIFKDVNVNMSLNRFQIYYWSSSSKKHGIHISGSEYHHSSEHSLKHVNSSADGLKHRSYGIWQTVSMNSNLSNAEIWLYNLGSEDLDEFNDFNPQNNVKNRQYFMSCKTVTYNKETTDIGLDEDDEFEMAVNDFTDSMSGADVQSNKGDDQATPNHRLVVHDLKAAWTKENRDVVIGIFDSFVKSQQLKRNLSTEALKPIRIETQNQPTHQQSITTNSPPHRHQRQPSTTSIIITGITNPVSSVSKSRAVSMLQKLIADSENNPTVHAEDSHSGVASETHLYGVEACQMDDLVDILCQIELINSQVAICGTETPGYVIVSAAHTEVRRANHLPVWKNRALLSKTSWTGSLKCMQYYATVDAFSQDTNNKSVFSDENDIQWLDSDNIDTKSVFYDYSDLVGCGHSVGGVISPIVGKLGRLDSDEGPTQVQLQRIISRCNCLFYYANHREGVADDMQHLIPPLSDDEMFIEPWDKEVGVDSFTLTHQDLDISTNSQQYAMIMDIINNLLLFVEPHKKTAFENLERMRFQFQLNNDEDQREPISQLQDQLRKYVTYLRRLERERYLVYRASIDDSMMADSDRDYRLSLNTLTQEIILVKDQINSASEELAMMINCYKEMQLGAHKAQEQQAAASQHGTGAFFANVIKRNEICFKKARWRVTDSDGQLGLADIVLSNFLYSKVVKSDDSVEHTIELGHLHVSNLIPNQAYKDVLHPTELQANIPVDRQRALRVYCRELAPVAGIPVKEHLEVNVIPFTVEVTLQFFQKMVKFFFPEKDSPKEEKSKSKSIDSSGEHQMSRFGGKRKRDKGLTSTSDHLSVTSSGGSSGGRNSGLSGTSMTGTKTADDAISTMSTATINSTNTVSSLNSTNQRRGDEIEKMRERAAKNHTFVYVKIPGIPIKVSYKGKKQKNVTDLKNISLTLPTFEYHNSTWTWLDLLMSVKNDSKHTVIKQALKQKMKIRPSSIWSKSSNSDQRTPAIETTTKEKCTTPVTDEDKARLLLGQYAKITRPAESGSPRQWQIDSLSTTTSNSSSSHLNRSQGSVGSNEANIRFESS